MPGNCLKRAEDWKKAAAGSCDSIVPGLLVNYEGEWEGAFPVCVNTKCEAHFGSAPESPEDAKRRAEREKLQAAVKRENEIRARMLEAVISQTTTLKPATLRAFVLHSVEFSPDCLDKVLPHSMTVLKKAKIDSPEFAKAVVGHLVGEHAEVSEYDGPDECKKEFHEQLGELGIDWKALRAKFETELYATLAAKEQPAKPKTPADLASLPVTPGWLSKTRKLPTKKAKAVAKKPAAKAAKKAAKKGSRK
jgi:hypothetical protein